MPIYVEISVFAGVVLIVILSEIFGKW